MNTLGAIIVMGALAAVWWTVGAARLGRNSLLISAVGVVISGLIVVLAWRRGGRPAAPQERKRLGGS